MKFNIFILFFLLLIIENGEGLQLLNEIGDQSLLFQIQEKCILESGATPGDIVQIVLRISPIRKEGKCLISCILRAIGIKDIASKLQELGSTLLERLSEDNPELYDRVMKVVGKCAAEIYGKELEDTCELAFEIISCGIREGLTGSIGNLFSVLVSRRRNRLLLL